MPIVYAPIRCKEVDIPEKPQPRPKEKPYVPPRKEGEIVPCRVTEVLDGDTIKVTRNDNHETMVVRLYGIDAPETTHGTHPGQLYSDVSKSVLDKKVGGYGVNVEVTGIDKYGRTIGIVYKGGENVNATMVKTGMAWAEPYYLDDREAKIYSGYEAEAKEKARGLWAYPFQERPSDYRYAQRVKDYEALIMAGKKEEIIVPAWNDVIHLVRPPSYDDKKLAEIKEVWTRYDVVGWTPPRIAEYMGLDLSVVLDDMAKYLELEELNEERKRTAINLSKSPTPQIAMNIGVIMTALDDTQDFMTTVGALGRVLGRVFKPAELLSIGAFTVGEFLNRLSLFNQLTGGEKAIVCKLVKELKKSSRWSTIKADVDKRMKRLFPTKGEWCEILQTTDTLFGVGISLGPLVGLAQDLVFGLSTGQRVRFKEWKVSDREWAVIKEMGNRLMHPEIGFKHALKDIAGWAESAANVVVTGNYQPWENFATSLVTTVYTGVQTRYAKAKDALISIWDTIRFNKATAKKKTKTSTRLLLEELGYDPYAQDGWPVEGLGMEASIQEIMDAYSAQAQKVLHFWRQKLGVSPEGLFLDACVREISYHAAEMFRSEDGNVYESLDKHALAYIHALENNLNPPASSKPEDFTAWMDYIIKEMDANYMKAPDLALLRRAHSLYFS